MDVVGITEAIALIGALVGGLVARQRKKEAERLNEQLRKINMQLRQQARAGTVYAPGLSYAPVGRQSFSSSTAATATIPLNTTDTEQETKVSMPQLKAFSSTDEELSPEQENCRQVMREGKRLLRSNQGTPVAYLPSACTNCHPTMDTGYSSSLQTCYGNPAFDNFTPAHLTLGSVNMGPIAAGAAALVRFEKALLMSQKLMDRILQRRALRGMAASSRMVVWFRGTMCPDNV